jgi:hypothetical protein
MGKLIYIISLSLYTVSFLPRRRQASFIASSAGDGHGVWQRILWLENAHRAYADDWKIFPHFDEGTVEVHAGDTLVVNLKLFMYFPGNERVSVWCYRRRKWCGENRDSKGLYTQISMVVIVCNLGWSLPNILHRSGTQTILTMQRPVFFPLHCSGAVVVPLGSSCL